MDGLVEVCPECGFENHFFAEDYGNGSAWTAKCHNCGEEILLCDHCFNENGQHGRDCANCPHGEELRRAKKEAMA